MRGRFFRAETCEFRREPQERGEADEGCQLGIAARVERSAGGAGQRFKWLMGDGMPWPGEKLPRLFLQISLIAALDSGSRPVLALLRGRL